MQISQCFKISAPVLVLLVAGCVRQPRFNKAKLNEIRSSNQVDQAIEKDGVIVGARVLTKSESIEIFDKDLHNNSVYPIVLRFENNSQKQYLFSGKSIIGMNIMGQKDVFNVLQIQLDDRYVKSVFFPPIISALTVAGGVGLFFAPFAAIGSVFSLGFSAAQVSVCSTLLPIVLPIIPIVYLLGTLPRVIIWNASKSSVNTELLKFTKENNISNNIYIGFGFKDSIIYFSNTEPSKFEIVIFGTQNNANINYQFDLNRRLAPC